MDEQDGVENKLHAEREATRSGNGDKLPQPSRNQSSERAVFLRVCTAIADPESGASRVRLVEKPAQASSTYEYTRTRTCVMLHAACFMHRGKARYYH
jgi:hypothetical protein